MQPLTTSLLSQVCRIFMALAYPAGPLSIPEKKRAYWELPEDQPITAFLPPAACALGVCQELRGRAGIADGYELRLGSSGFPHLKLRLQPVQQSGNYTWVYMVDTHDAFSRDTRCAPPDHPDAKQWQALQCANQLLKEKIEAAFEQAGMATFNSMLRDQLKE